MAALATAWSCALRRLAGARGLASSADAKHRSTEMRARRQLRVASKLQRALSELLADGSRVRTASTAADVIVTAVTVSSDLKAATAFWLPEPRSRVPVPTLAKLLARQAPGLSHRLSNRAELRSVPRLAFKYDESLVGTQRVASLIELLALDRERREGGPSPAAEAGQALGAADGTAGPGGGDAGGSETAAGSASRPPPFSASS